MPWRNTRWRGQATALDDAPLRLERALASCRGIHRPYDLQHLVVLAFEARRAGRLELQRERHGLVTDRAPSLRTASATDSSSVSSSMFRLSRYSVYIGLMSSSIMARQPPCLVCFASRYSTEKRRAAAALFCRRRSDPAKKWSIR